MIKTMNEQEQILYMQARLTRTAAEKWHESLAEVMKVFTRYGVLEYIESCYELFHVQGDEANFAEIANYLNSKETAIC